MNTKILFLVMAILFLSNLSFLLQAIRYRNVLVQRNKSYQETTTFPRYKNINNEFRLLKKNNKYYNNSTIFIGSSIIERWDFEKYFKHKPFLNRGVGDDNSSDLLKRFKEDVIELRPTRVVIYLGTNDVKNHFRADRSKENLEVLLKLSFKNKIDTLVLLLLPVDYNNNPSLYYTHPLEQIKELSEQLIKTCEKYGVKYVDLFSSFGERKDLSALLLKDGLHLNEKGYQILSSLVLKALNG